MKIFFILLCFFASQGFAHQPKLIKYSPSLNNPHIVVQPEISKAYYSELDGSSHFYKINSEKKFLFYAGILSPKINEKYKWFSIDVLDENNNIVYKADGENFIWKPWYEPYARDWYWKGPEIGKDTNKEFKTSFLIKKGLTNILSVRPLTFF